jgi:hypothetical protein
MKVRAMRLRAARVSVMKLLLEKQTRARAPQKVLEMERA